MNKDQIDLVFGKRINPNKQTPQAARSSLKKRKKVDQSLMDKQDKQELKEVWDT